MRIWVAALMMGATVASAQVQDNTLPPALEGVAFEQRLGSDLPLDARFVDATGKAIRLGELFGDRPAVLALVYYECPMLCNLVLNGLVASLRAVDFDPGREFDVVAVSFDPREDPDLAAAKRAGYVESYGREGTEAGWHFLTGDAEAIRRLTEAVGFRYNFDEESGEFAHSAGVVLATADGRVARYFFGVEYPPRDLRLGLVEASDNRIGSVVDQVLLYCFHYDAVSGRYSFATLTAVRIGGVLTVAVLLGFMITMLRRERAGTAAPANLR